MLSPHAHPQHQPLARRPPRRMKSDRVLITGTTSGLGRALLDYYAARARHVICVNRRPPSERMVAYPNARFECIDVRCRDEVNALISRLAESNELPDVFILNAGINRVDNDEHFDLDIYREVAETNLFGVLNFVEPLLRQTPRHNARHVIAISSMASYVGNPYAMGYHTSKRALTACFNVWSNMYAGTDLVFQQVMLGPIRTPMYTMADKLPAWMVRIKGLFSVSAESAAAAIARFARTRRYRLFFPRRAVPLYAAMRLGQTLVAGFFRGQKTLDNNPRRKTTPKRVEQQ